MTATTVADSFLALHGGQNSYGDPILLSAENYAKGINITVRGGLAKTRPGFVAETVVGMPTGTFQGAHRWSLEDGDRLVFVVSGTVYVLAVDTNALTTIGAMFPSDTTQCWFCQADRYMVIQDGVSTPAVLDNDEYDAPQLCEEPQGIPIGTAMYFVFQRLHVAANDPGRQYFKSGDVLIPTDPPSCLLFQELDYWATGGAHCLPMELGYVHGMIAFRNASTGTGVGSLLVFARNGVVAYDLSIPRIEWPEANTSQVLFYSSGSVSPWSFASVNDDVLYRSTDGLRSVRYTKAAVGSESGMLANTPMSLRANEWFVDEPREYLPFVSSASWNNYALVTVGGHDTRYFNGIVAMDAAATHALVGSSVPIFAGVWTGYAFAQILTAFRSGKLECFVFTEGPELLTISEDAVTDSSTVDIKSRLVTRSYNFGEAAYLKKLQYLDLWVSNVYRDSTITVYFKPTGYPKWNILGSRSVQKLASYPGYRRKLRFSMEQPQSFCDTTTGGLLDTGTEFQFAIDVEGNATLERCVVVGERYTEQPPDPCDTTIAETTLVGMDLSDWDYDVSEGL